MAWPDRLSLGADVRYAVRVLARQRGFAAVAILTTALAIGVTTTLFSVFDAVLLRPLPWPGSDRLVRLTETRAGATRLIPLSVTTPVYLAVRDRVTAFSGIGAWSRGSAMLATAEGPSRTPIASVTPETFAMLRAVPLAGRLFTADDAAEVVVSYGLWTTRYGAAADVIGRACVLDGRTFTIVGIMPPGFVFPDRDTRMWRPLRIPPPPQVTTFSVMARLRDGVSLERAAGEATVRARTAVVSTNALLAIFGSRAPATIAVAPALDALTQEVRPGVIMVFAAGALLFVTALANLASLQLARASTRYREMAIRSALGARTRRLVQQLVVEQVCLAGAGGAVGGGLTVALHRMLPALLPADFPRLGDIAVRGPVVAVALALTALTAVLLGVLPAVQLRRLRLTEAITEGGAGSIGGRHARGRVTIMTAQIAIAAMLLIVASLLGRSFAAMMGQDRGFDPAHVLTAQLTLPDFAFAPPARIEAAEEFVARAQALPGALAVAVTTGLPLSGSENISGFGMPSVRPPVGVQINAHAVRAVVTPGYLRALGLRLAAGRDFRPEDDSASAPKVVIVNRTFAKQYLTERALGDRIRNFMNGDGIDFEVVGIIDDVRKRGVTDPVQPEIYSLLRQSPRPSTTQDVVIRTVADPRQMAEPLRQLVRGIGSQAGIDSLRTMDDRILGRLARPRLYAVLLVVFAVSALALAGVGLVGLLSYVVAQRRREMALRMALGATPRQVAWLVLSHGLAVTAIGVTAVLAAAFVTSRYLATLVYGVSLHDRVSFVAAPLALAVMAAAACAAPALRAMRVDPRSGLLG